MESWNIVFTSFAPALLPKGVLLATSHRWMSLGLTTPSVMWLLLVQGIPVLSSIAAYRQTCVAADTTFDALWPVLDHHPTSSVLSLPSIVHTETILLQYICLVTKFPTHQLLWTWIISLIPHKTVITLCIVLIHSIISWLVHLNNNAVVWCHRKPV